MSEANYIEEGYNEDVILNINHVYGDGEYWQTKDKNKIKISSMTDSHLRNAYNYIISQGKIMNCNYGMPDNMTLMQENDYEELMDYLQEREESLKIEINRRANK